MKARRHVRAGDEAQLALRLGLSDPDPACSCGQPAWACDCCDPTRSDLAGLALECVYPTIDCPACLRHWRERRPFELTEGSQVRCEGCGATLRCEQDTPGYRWTWSAE